MDDDKLSTADTSDMEGESATRFWNESANKSDSNTEEGDEERDEVDENGSDLDVDELRAKRAVGPEVQKKERI